MEIFIQDTVGYWDKISYYMTNVPRGARKWREKSFSHFCHLVYLYIMMAVAW